MRGIGLDLPGPRKGARARTLGQRTRLRRGAPRSGPPGWAVQNRDSQRREEEKRDPKTSGPGLEILYGPVYGPAGLDYFP